MRHVAGIALLVLFTACGQAASTGTAADEQAIRDGANKWAQSWNAGDAKTMAELVSDNYEAIDASGIHTQGRPAFESAMAEQFATRSAGMTMTITTGFVKWLGATSAVAGGGWSVTSADPSATSRGTWLSAYQKRDGTWRIASGLGATEPPSMPMVSDTAHIE